MTDSAGPDINHHASILRDEAYQELLVTTNEVQGEADFSVALA